jgi:hypothetical protein
MIEIDDVARFRADYKRLKKQIAAHIAAQRKAAAKRRII